MASAKLANNTVNQSHSVICRLNLNAAPPLNSSTVVITLPISTTNMTGFPIILRGFSLSRASHTRSEEHTSELQSPCISYAVFCLKKNNKQLVTLVGLAPVAGVVSCGVVLLRA